MERRLRQTTTDSPAETGDARWRVFLTIEESKVNRPRTCSFRQERLRQLTVAQLLVAHMLVDGDDVDGIQHRLLLVLGHGMAKSPSTTAALSAAGKGSPRPSPRRPGCPMHGRGGANDDLEQALAGLGARRHR